MRSTSRFGFAGVPFALKLKRFLLRLLEVALVVASWRAVLHCTRGNSPSPLLLSCCARGRVVLYRSRGRPPNPFFHFDRPRRCVWLCCARKRAVCIAVGGDPRAPFSLFLSLLFAHLPEPRDIHEAPNHASVL
jgi:hypothetical protein